MAEPVTFSLPLYCPVCGKPVSVEFASWPHDRDAPVISQAWTCPYDDCRSKHMHGFQGRISRVTARYTPK